MTKVLSISGGGIRGILPCCSLVELERQTGKLTRDVVDFCGGTSTGSLLTVSIAAGVPATKALEVYVQSGPKIFAPTNPVLRTVDLVSRGRQFDNRVLYQVVKDTLGINWHMSFNDSRIGLLITAGNTMGDCWYFTHDRPTNASTTGRANVLDAAVASSCAPTYHDPWIIPGFGHFFDGGAVSLADPVYQVCVEAFSGPHCYGSIDPADATVISLGTGYYTPKAMPAPPDNLLANIQWVTSSLVGSSRTLAQQAADRQWPGVVQAFNPQLPKDIDEADVDSIPMLLEIGRRAAAAMDWHQILNAAERQVICK